MEKAAGREAKRQKNGINIKMVSEKAI